MEDKWSFNFENNSFGIIENGQKVGTIKDFASGSLGKVNVSFEDGSNRELFLQYFDSNGCMISELERSYFKNSKFSRTLFLAAWKKIHDNVLNKKSSIDKTSTGSTGNSVEKVGKTPEEINDTTSSAENGDNISSPHNNSSSNSITHVNAPTSPEIPNGGNDAEKETRTRKPSHKPTCENANRLDVEQQITGEDFLISDCFEVHISNLHPPENERLVRELQENHVQEIKRVLRTKETCYTIFIGNIQNIEKSSIKEKRLKKKENMLLKL